MFMLLGAGEYLAWLFNRPQGQVQVIYITLVALQLLCVQMCH